MNRFKLYLVTHTLLCVARDIQSPEEQAKNFILAPTPVKRQAITDDVLLALIDQRAVFFGDFQKAREYEIAQSIYYRDWEWEYVDIVEKVSVLFEVIVEVQLGLAGVYGIKHICSAEFFGSVIYPDGSIQQEYEYRNLDRDVFGLRSNIDLTWSFENSKDCAAQAKWKNAQNNAQMLSFMSGMQDSFRDYLFEPQVLKIIKNYL